MKTPPLHQRNGGASHLPLTLLPFALIPVVPVLSIGIQENRNAAWVVQLVDCRAQGTTNPVFFMSYGHCFIAPRSSEMDFADSHCSPLGAFSNSAPQS